MDLPNYLKNVHTMYPHCKHLLRDAAGVKPLKFLTSLFLSLSSCVIAHFSFKPPVPPRLLLHHMPLLRYPPTARPLPLPGSYSLQDSCTLPGPFDLPGPCPVSEILPLPDPCRAIPCSSTLPLQLGSCSLPGPSPLHGPVHSRHSHASAPSHSQAPAFSSLTCSCL